MTITEHKIIYHFADIKSSVLLVAIQRENAITLISVVFPLSRNRILHSMRGNNDISWLEAEREYETLMKPQYSVVCCLLSVCLSVPIYLQIFERKWLWCLRQFPFIAIVSSKVANDLTVQVNTILCYTVHGMVWECRTDWDLLMVGNRKTLARR